MALLLALLALLRASAATTDCPLLADDERGFHVTRIDHDEWEAEVGFIRWVPKAQVRLQWPRATEVASVSAAHIVEVVADGATIVLDSGTEVAFAGGAEGRSDSGSVVLVVKREPGANGRPSTPAISCNYDDELHDEIHTAVVFGLSPPPPPPQERGALQLSHPTSQSGCVSGASLVASDLRLTSRAVLGGRDDSCSALELQLQPALTAPLCDPSDEIALEWRSEAGDGAWRLLHDVASEAGWEQATQAAALAGGTRDPPLRASAAGVLLLHGLSPSTVYAFRLRLTRAPGGDGDGSFDGAGPESGAAAHAAASTFGPSTGETIIDGGSLLSLLGVEPPRAEAVRERQECLHLRVRQHLVRRGDDRRLVRR